MPIKKSILSLTTLFGLAVIVCFNRCTTESNQRMELKNKKSDSVSSFDQIDYPNVQYHIGTSGFEEVLSELIELKGNEIHASFDDKLIVAKRLFEADSNIKAFDAALSLLADFLERDPAGFDHLDSLILAEVFYQSSRSFFYERYDVFTPTVQFVNEGMNISKELISTNDTLVQRAALFQLARFYDVMEGLTAAYTRFVSPLDCRDHMFASRNSLFIKDSLLHIKGGAIVRSISNMAIDNDQSFYAGCTYDRDSLSSELIRLGFEHVSFLKKAEKDKYGEFVNVIMGKLGTQAYMNEDYELAQRAIEKRIAFMSNVDTFKLGQEVNSSRITEGSSHHLPGMASSLDRLIQTTGKYEFKSTLFSLMARIDEIYQMDLKNGQKSIATANYERADLPIVLADGTTGSEYNLNYADTKELIEKRIGQINFAQSENKLKQKFSVISKDTIDPINEMYLLENDLRNAEIALSKSVDPHSVRSCVRAFLKYKKSVISYNNLVMSLDSQEIKVNISEIQSGLKSNEMWVTIYSSSIEDYVIELFLVTKDSLIVRKIDLVEKVRNDSLNLKESLELLEATILNGGKWERAEKATLRASSEAVLGSVSILKPHIVLSAQGAGSRIWEAVFRDFYHSNGCLLSSFRLNDDLLFSNQEAYELNSEKKLLAIAPNFQIEKSFIEENQRKEMLARLNQEDETESWMDLARKADERLNPWKTGRESRKIMGLRYNIKEVEAINNLIGGYAMIGDRTSEEEFLKEVSDYSIIHISSHAFMNENDIYRSGILLNGNGTAESDGDIDDILYAYEIRGFDLKAELVVLSACETGISPNRRSSYDWSLGRAFREAGAKNTVTTLWNVNDKSTHDVIINFYKELKVGKGKAEALFDAKNKYIENHPDINPHYWLPLVLTGDNDPIKFE